MRLPVLEQPTSSPLMQSRRRCYIDICRRHLHHHLIVNKVGAVQEQNNNNHIFSRDIPLPSPFLSSAAIRSDHLQRFQLTRLLNRNNIAIASLLFPPHHHLTTESRSPGSQHTRTWQPLLQKQQTHKFTLGTHWIGHRVVIWRTSLNHDSGQTDWSFRIIRSRGNTPTLEIVVESSFRVNLIIYSSPNRMHILQRHKANQSMDLKRAKYGT